MKRQILIAVAAIASLIALYPAQAASAGVESYSVDANHSEVGFQIRHLMSKVRGSFDRFAGTITLDVAAMENSAVDFTIESASISTRHEKRDGHLRSPDFFDVAKFPAISFKSSKVKPLGGDRYDVTGTFTMRGVTKELTLPVTYLGAAKDPRGNPTVGFETSIQLNRKEYGVNWNAALDQGGFMLSDEVTVLINIEAKVAPPAAPKTP
jgi:polyisoprenoid-binding protein YceI